MADSPKALNKAPAAHPDAFLPADRHFVRQVVLALIQGRALASTSPLDEKRIENFVKQAQLALDVVKRAERSSS